MHWYNMVRPPNIWKIPSKRTTNSKVFHTRNIRPAHRTAHYSLNRLAPVQTRNRFTYIRQVFDQRKQVLLELEVLVECTHNVLQVITCMVVYCRTTDCTWIRCELVHWRRPVRVVVYLANLFTCTIHKKWSTTGSKIFLTQTVAALKMRPSQVIPMPLLVRMIIEIIKRNILNVYTFI